MLDRKGWALDQWHALPADEQELWAAYEVQREQVIDQVGASMREKKDNEGRMVNWTPEVAAMVALERYA